LSLSFCFILFFPLKNGAQFGAKKQHRIGHWHIVGHITAHAALAFHGSSFRSALVLTYDADSFLSKKRIKDFDSDVLHPAMITCIISHCGYQLSFKEQIPAS